MDILSVILLLLLFLSLGFNVWAVVQFRSYRVKMRRAAKIVPIVCAISFFAGFYIGGKQRVKNGLEK